MSVVALVPSRKNSKRLPGKGLRVLGGRPLIEWTLEAAVESGCYDEIVVCSDDDAALAIAEKLNVGTFRRPPVSDSQPDLEWVVDVMRTSEADVFSLLRVTSPFRDAETIRQAWKRWDEVSDTVDSLRAVRKVSEHPHKQWHVLEPSDMEPIAGRKFGQVWNQPTQSLFSAYVQTAGLEIAHTRNLPHSISGTRVAPYILEGPAALDINCLQDWWIAERYITEGLVTKGGETLGSPHL